MTTGAIQKQKKPYQPRTMAKRQSDIFALLDLTYTNPNASFAELAELLYAKTGTRITPRQINNDVNKGLEMMANQELNELKLVRVREIERLNRLEQEAWDAWRNSQKITEETVREVSGALQNLIYRAADDLQMTDNMILAEVVKLTRTGPGDFQFLRLILEVQKQRQRLMGLMAINVNVNKRTLEVKTYQNWSPDNWDSGPVIEGEVDDDDSKLITSGIISDEIEGELE